MTNEEIQKLRTVLECVNNAQRSASADELALTTALHSALAEIEFLRKDRDYETRRAEAWRQEADKQKHARHVQEEHAKRQRAQLDAIANRAAADPEVIRLKAEVAELTALLEEAD